MTQSVNVWDRKGGEQGIEPSAVMQQCYYTRIIGK